MHKFIKLFTILLLLAGCSKTDEGYNLVIETSDGKQVEYLVESALTPMEQAKGLMNRNELATNGGMIFQVHPVRRVAMWMKATQIPLDMIFIGPDSTIVDIHENAKPLSEEHIMSKKPVRAVIEVNGGDVKKHGIKIGDKVKHEILGNLPAINKKSPAKK